MPRGRRHYSDELKAQALARYLNGESGAKIARDLGVTRFQVARWVKAHDPSHTPQAPAVYKRNVDELSSLVYDTVIETLNSIRTRAIETGRPEWIKAQTADQLAALDTAQWDRVIRVISAFRPRDSEEPAAPDDGGEYIDQQQPGVHRNGAVDPAS